MPTNEIWQRSSFNYIFGFCMFCIQASILKRMLDCAEHDLGLLFKRIIAYSFVNIS